jgi:signal transduction histidine kinase
VTDEWKPASEALFEKVELNSMLDDILSTQTQPATPERSSQRTGSHATAEHLALEVLHEIRNPLEALGNLVFLANEEAESPAKVRQFMRLAEEQIATLNHIASQTLGFARSSPSPKSTDLADLMKSAVRIHQRTIDGRKIQLVKDLPEDLYVEVYRTELLQVLSNLLANALDALPMEGSLCLRLRKRQNEVHLIVSDSGQGIPAADMAQIFEPFFTTKDQTGTGIGLSLVRKIVEHHRGRIRVRSSVRAGKSGTTFRVSLPA